MKDLRHMAVLATLVAVLAWGCDGEPDPVAPTGPSPVASVQATEGEPNNSCSGVQDLGSVTLPLTVDGELSGFPLPSGDVDFFKFTGTPNTSVRVDLEGQATGQGTLGNPYLGFFDSGCNLVATNDDNGVNLNSRLVISIPGDGVTILAVTRCCDGGFNEGGIGTYQLSVEEVLPPPNDDFTSAQTIPEPLPFLDTVDVTAATLQASEPTPSCGFGSADRTAWFTFTATQTRSVSAKTLNTFFATVVATYTGTALDNLSEVACAAFGSPATFGAEAGTTYFVQVGGLFGQSGPLELQLENTPPPTAQFGFFPSEPSAYDVAQFYDFSYDPGGLGIQSQEWDFGDGGTATGQSPTHQYASDGSYEVGLTVTTVDGRTASTSQTVLVATHDIAITKLAAPKAASAGQTRQIVVGINSRRHDETVEVQLLKSVPGGFEFVGVLIQTVPVRSSNRTTDFDFSYTFTADDARIRKVTFKAIANLIGARDALPADNEAIAPPTKVGR